MGIQEIIQNGQNHAYFDDQLFECYTTRTRNVIELGLNDIDFNPPKGGPLSEESENVRFRTGLTSTYKIGDIIINIAKNMDCTITYTVIVLKTPTQLSWVGVLKLWNLKPLFSGS